MPRSNDDNTFSYLAKLDREDVRQERAQKTAERKLIAALNSCSAETKQSFADLLRQ